MNPIAAPALLAVVKVTLLFGAALMLVAALKRNSAAVRHMICLLALGGSFLAIPLSFAPAPLTVPVAIAIAGGAAPGRTAAPANQAPWAEILLIVWCCGALVVMARYAAGVLAVRRIIARSTSVSNDAWRRDLSALGASDIDVRIAPIQTPVTCGFFRPLILIPFEGEGWSPSHRLAVLTHELAHIRRRDLWWGAVAALATAVFWFHPFAWLLAARMRQEQECACDDAVLSRGMAPSRYAELLLDTARETAATPVLACAMTGRHAFRSRIEHVLDPGRKRTIRASAMRRIGAAASVAVLALAVLQPAWTQDDVYPIGGEVKAPVLIHKVEPKYTEAAKDAKIEGQVIVDVIVGANGRIRDVRIVKSLDAGLDNNALDALSEWVFEPGTKKGEPVAVKARVEMNFRLK